MLGRISSGLVLALLVGAGCSEYTTKPQSLVLPTSNKAIDTVLHRSDVRFLDCGTLAVIQTFDGTGKLIDAQAARGRALHCGVIETSIEAGSRIGAASIVAHGLVKAAKATRPDQVNINNANTQTQGQGQEQNQTYGAGEGGGEGEGGGNNGGGNGDDDGTNGGTDNHHDNGDPN